MPDRKFSVVPVNSADGVAGGPQPPDNDDMDRRLTVLETRLDTILPSLATKADLTRMQLALVIWTVATAIALGGALIGFLNLTKSPPQQAPQPIGIQVPAQQPLSPPGK